MPVREMYYGPSIPKRPEFGPVPPAIPMGMEKKLALWGPPPKIVVAWSA